MNIEPYIPTVKIRPEDLAAEAGGLLSVDGENPEYDRAIVELCLRLNGLPLRFYAAVETALRQHADRNPRQLISVGLDDVDLLLLRKQRDWLVEQANAVGVSVSEPVGIVNLLDTMIDQAEGYMP